MGLAHLTCKGLVMDYISSILLECYKEHIENESYIAEKKELFEQNENKYQGLMCLFNADERIRKSFAKKLNVDYEELKIFLHVLQRT